MRVDLTDGKCSRVFKQLQDEGDQPRIYVTVYRTINELPPVQAVPSVAQLDCRSGGQRGSGDFRSAAEEQLQLTERVLLYRDVAGVQCLLDSLTSLLTPSPSILHFRFCLSGQLTAFGISVSNAPWGFHTSNGSRARTVFYCIVAMSRLMAVVFGRFLHRLWPFHPPSSYPRNP